MARILLIDDSRLITSQMKNFLEQEGHEVVEVANDGNEGFRAYKQHNPDVCFLDITMPNKDGIQCLEEIVTSYPDAKIIMLSALKEPEKAEVCEELGASAFLSKPIKLRNPNYAASVRSVIFDVLSQ